MESLVIHFSSFLVIFPIGITRLISCLSLYLKNPSHYRSKSWYFSESRWKSFDFYILLIGLPISSVFIFSLFLVISGHPSYKFAFLQQSLVILFFWVLLILIFLKESYKLALIPENFLYVYAGVAFLIECMMTGEAVVGYGEAMYGWLGGLGFVCAACCLFLSIRPSAFFAEFLLCFGMILKGTWVLQVGLSLYTDTFLFSGCERLPFDVANGRNFIKCELDEYKYRSEALVNLMFIGHVIVVLIISFLLSGLLSHFHNRKSFQSSGQLLAGFDAENSVVRPVTEFELD
ncbi:hypothetical protein DCAR_0832203 [Daucus carota subsp. sativus]|uniref:Uncharacterized protein n=1 Tax=Daucus carota subsp. sativus TaxID=79200 RepID=A0AAF1BDZ1_DAUCS|nr:PREDICTED: uncharacterized protein LOC108197030 [Daucus carota subsp. sativus]WOH12696.1 hypothetical protein DCAR_0832203 [Daucus carota subsp. sativus]